MTGWRSAAPLAHAFGERYDSPVPLGLFVLGGAAVVVLSFVLVYGRGEVGTALDDDLPGGVTPSAVEEELRPAPRGRRAVAGASVLALAASVAIGALGAQEVAENLLAPWFWLVVWVVLPLLVAVIGDFTRPVNPFLALARLADRPALRQALIGTPHRLPWPRPLGWWPAVLGFVVVVVGELVVNQQATLPRVIATGLVVHALVSLGAGLVAGADAVSGRGELFSVLFATWGRLGFWRFGALGRRGFAGGFGQGPGQGFDAHPSRVVFVMLLLIAVTFDGVLSTPQWGRLLDRLPGDGTPSGSAGELAAVVAFAVIGAAMLAGFATFAAASARAGGRRPPAWPVWRALTGLLPSLIPIALGYQLAHYLQYIAINGQLLIPLLGDPAGRGWSLLPPPFTDDYVVNTSVMPNTIVWWVQVLAIVTAHVLAVVLAHRHLLAVAPHERAARRSEWPWLVAMVGYTMLSLWLLAQPVLAGQGGH